jgi:hypothetical protein
MLGFSFAHGVGGDILRNLPRSKADPAGPSAKVHELCASPDGEAAVEVDPKIVVSPEGLCTPHAHPPAQRMMGRDEPPEDDESPCGGVRKVPKPPAGDKIWPKS